MELTKEAIRRLLAAEIEVNIMNGCFNRASIRAEFYHHVYELTVDVTHPLLIWQCGNHNAVRLIKWFRTGRGEPVRLAASLREKIREMQRAATMTDDDARTLSERNMCQLRALERELGLVR